MLMTQDETEQKINNIMVKFPRSRNREQERKKSRRDGHGVKQMVLAKTLWESRRPGSMTQPIGCHVLETVDSPNQSSRRWSYPTSQMRVEAKELSVTCLR